MHFASVQLSNCLPEHRFLEQQRPSELSKRNRVTESYMAIQSSYRQPLNRFLLLASLLIILLGSFWRFGNLGGDSFWHDEMITVRNAQAGLQAMYHPHHAPLLHILTYFVINTIGETEFTIRFPAAIAGVLALALMIRFGKAIGRPRAGLWATLLLALLPFHLRYSQEIRYYAPLMFFSLLTFVLLHQVLVKPTVVRWIAFALATVLNLYTHYGALVVLAGQSIVIGVWILSRIRRGQIKVILQPAIAALVISILYSPWLSQMLLAIDTNTGSNAMGGTSDFTPPLSTWVREAFLAFGFGQGLLPFLIIVLCIIGFGVWAWRRDWITLSLAAVGLVTPLLFITTFNVARWAFPKYVIYMLPLYLIAAGVALDALFDQIDRRLITRQRLASVGIPLLAAVTLVIVTRPLLREEHAYVEGDWKGITQYTEPFARNKDVFVSMALDLPNGYNQGAFVWPYYLDKTFNEYTFVASNHLLPKDVETLANTNTNLWMVLLNRVNPISFQEGTAQVTPFQNSFFLVHPTIQADSNLQQLIAMYQQMIPMAVAPSPQCLLQQDLAAMYVAEKDYASAEEMADAANNACPGEEIPKVNRYLLLSQIYQGLLQQYQQEGRTDQLPAAEDKARTAATELLRLGFRDPDALRLLTVEDLIQAFVSGEAQAPDAAAPEPVQVRRYTMPQNGDWSDVLFVHAGASVSFPVVLPGEPVELYFRGAMDPDSWDWGGDGATFVIRIETASGESRELYRKYISNDISNRRWHDELIPLAEFAGQSVTLTFTTEPGPSGDYTGDWAGWGMPLIVLSPE